MLCKGVVQEERGPKACWLPSEDISSGFCRRCRFQYITETLDEFIRGYARGLLHPPNEILLNDKVFLEELLHPAREQALLTLLSVLFQTNKIQFQRLVEGLKSKAQLSILLTKRIQAHQDGARCKMYRHFLKDSSLYNAPSLCWSCWSCIAWSLKQRNQHLLTLYQQSFPLNFSRLNALLYAQAGPRVFVDMFVSLHFFGKDHHIRILLDQLFRVLPFEDFKSLLLHFLLQPSMFFVLYEKKEQDFIPLPLRDEEVLREFRSQMKAFIKRWTGVYKEELIQRTWHPKRLFPWCLDIDEWKDFGVSSANCSLIYDEFLLSSC
jgi:hypothetical protein